MIRPNLPDGGPAVPNFQIAFEFSHAFFRKQPLIRLRFLKKGWPAYEREDYLDRGLWQEVERFQSEDYNVHYFLNSIKPGPGMGMGGHATDADVQAFRCQALDKDTGELIQPEDFMMPPDIVVNTSPGKYQYLWLIPQPHSDAGRWRSTQRWLAAKYGGDASAVNPSRLFRLPGSLHLKDPMKPYLVTFSERE